MSGLPPLANLFAVHARHAAALAPIEAAMRAAGCFEVHRPFETWLVGVQPLPGGGQPVIDRGFFAEGAELTSAVPGAGSNHTSRQRLYELAEAAPHRLAELAGDFGFLLVRSDGATIVRSAAGLVPWYTYRTADLVVVSTRLAHFARLLARPPLIDPLVHASWTDGIVCPDRRTTFAGVRAVPAGHVVRVSMTGMDPAVRYWDPTPTTRPPKAGPSTTAAHAEELRRLLLQRIERDLDPAGGNLLGLSGGVDSSCLAALAAGPAQRPLMTFSFLPAADHDRLGHILRYVDPIADFVAPSRQWRIHLDEEARLASHRNAPRLGIPVAHPALSHLPSLGDEGGVRVYTGGEFADDLFAGPFVVWHDWLRELPLHDVVGGLGRRGRLPVRRRVPRAWVSARSRQALRRPMLPYRLRLPAVIRPELRREYRAWTRDRQRAMAGLPRPYRFLETSRQADGWVAQNWEVCSELGIRRSLPFYSREVIELAFACHPLEQAMPSKNLLRRGLGGDVPAINLQRTDKGSWSEADTVPWGRTLPDRLAAIVDAEWMERPPRRVSLDVADVLTCLEISTETVSPFRSTP